MNAKLVKSVTHFLELIRSDTKRWSHENFCSPWFRGQDDHQKPPLPSILRSDLHDREFSMTTSFRLKAPAFGRVPPADRLDQWLFLMQHVGLPTRLLDWTESPLVALYFALERYFFSQPADIETSPGIWCLDPLALNHLTDPTLAYFPNTWAQGVVLENFKIPFGTAGKDLQSERAKNGEARYFYYEPTEYPVAIQPSSVHARIASQRSCFTIHGNDISDFEALAKERKDFGKGLVKYKVPKHLVVPLARELFDYGLGPSTVFPDLDGLAKEFKLRAHLELRAI